MKFWNLINVLFALISVGASQSMAVQLPVRVCAEMQFQGSLVTSPGGVQLLDYCKRLGYTHVLYWMTADAKTVQASFAGNPWVYNSGSYSTGVIADDLRWANYAASSRGLTLIPYIATISHLNGFIAIDSSIWEFTGATWAAFVQSRWGGANDYISNSQLRHVAKLGSNPGLEQLFGEYLKIIKAVMGTPPYIHLGYDEPAHAQVLLLKQDRSKMEPGSMRESIDRHLQQRFNQIDQEFGGSPKVMIWADWMVAGSIAEALPEIHGDVSGVGGLVELLDSKLQNRNRLILMPWVYHLRDGVDTVEASLKLPNPIMVNKVKSLKYLNRFEIGVIPAGGESGHEYPDDSGRYSRSQDSIDLLIRATVQCNWEWLRAIDKYPKNIRGIAHTSWHGTYFCDPSGQTCNGYTLPWLAYWGWQSGANGWNIVRSIQSPHQLPVGVNYKQSRRNWSFTRGVDYFAPTRPFSSIGASD